MLVLRNAHGATYRVEHRADSSGRFSSAGGEAPTDRLDAVEAESQRELLRQVELVPALRRAAVDHLRQHLLAAEHDEDLRAARKHWMSDAHRVRAEHLAACGLARSAH